MSLRRWASINELVIRLTEPLALEERIASLITDSIAPRLLPDLEVLSHRKTRDTARLLSLVNRRLYIEEQNSLVDTRH
jgi:hypothetical protein